MYLFISLCDDTVIECLVSNVYLKNGSLYYLPFDDDHHSAVNVTDIFLFTIRKI